MNLKAQVKPALIDQRRKRVLDILDANMDGLPSNTAAATTLFQPEIFWAWGKATGDPDLTTLASWLRTKALLGFSEPIPSASNTGFFPPVISVGWNIEAAQLYGTITLWRTSSKTI